MDLPSSLLRRVARRWPALGRRRHWWFRPVHGLLLLALQTLCLAWLMGAENGLD